MPDLSLEHIRFAPAVDFSEVTWPSLDRDTFLRVQTLNLSDRPLQQPAMDDSAWRFVRWVFRLAGVNAGHYREQTFVRRLPACLRELRVDSIAGAFARITADPCLVERAVSALLLGVTSFFRDPLVFAMLRANVLPLILDRCEQPRIWSVGCSDGSELYSVAMLLREAGVLQNCELLGTDVRSAAIRSAIAARYRPGALAHLSDAAKRHFIPIDGDCFVVRDELRQRTTWLVRNAINTAAETGRWDLILCRNLAMYFHAPRACTLWRRLEESLRPGGFLIMGRAERPHGTTSLEPFAPCIYRKSTHRKSFHASDCKRIVAGKARIGGQN